MPPEHIVDKYAAWGLMAVVSKITEKRWLICLFRTFSSEIVSIIVGTVYTPRYDIHRQLLCRCSPYFKSILSTRSPSDTTTQELHFPDENPTAFVEFISWAYYGRISDDKYNLEPPSARILHFYRVWSLVEKLKVPALQDLAMAACKQVLDKSRSNELVGAVAIHHAYSKTGPGSIPRQFAVDSWVERAPKSVLLEYQASLPREFLADLNLAWFDRKEKESSNVGWHTYISMIPLPILFSSSSSSLTCTMYFIPSLPVLHQTTQISSQTESLHTSWRSFTFEASFPPATEKTQPLPTTWEKKAIAKPPYSDTSTSVKGVDDEDELFATVLRKTEELVNATRKKKVIVILPNSDTSISVERVDEEQLATIFGDTERPVNATPKKKVIVKLPNSNTSSFDEERLVTALRDLDQ